MSTTSLQQYGMGLAQQIGLPWATFNAWINQESGWNPSAVSSAGALGIAQIMPSTAQGWNVDPLDPYAALQAASAALKKYHDELGSWPLAFAAYNAGEGAVQKYGGVPPYSETQNYVQNIASTLPSGFDMSTRIGGGAPIASSGSQTSTPPQCQGSHWSWLPPQIWDTCSNQPGEIVTGAGKALTSGTSPFHNIAVDTLLFVGAAVLVLGGVVWVVFATFGDEIAGSIKETAKHAPEILAA